MITFQKGVMSFYRWHKNDFLLPPNWDEELKNFIKIVKDPLEKEAAGLLRELLNADSYTYDEKEELETKLAQIMKKYNEAIHEAKDYFGQDRPVIERVGQGTHDDVFFYAATTQRGEMSLITSDQKFFVRRVVVDREKGRPVDRTFDDIKDTFGLNYMHPFNEEAVEYPWKQTAILKYINNENGKIDPKELYKKIRDANEYFMDHADSRVHSYISCYTIATYCFTLFESMGRLYYNAERGSGKSKQAKLNKLCMFNSMWITGATESAIVRDLEATCGVPIVDNFDKLNEDIKNMMHHLIETGIYPEAKYRKTDTDTMKTTSFSTFSPMVINNIYGLDDDTIDKCFEINLFKTKTAKKDRKIDVKSPLWKDIRNSCRCWVLGNWKDIQITYKNLTLEGFDGRFADVIKGTLAIAKMVGDDVFSELVDLATEKYNESKTVSVDGDWNYVLFNDIKNQLQGKDDWISIMQIAESITPLIKPIRQKSSHEGSYDDEADKKTKIIWVCRWIPKALKTYPFFKKKKLKHGRTMIFVKFSDLIKVMESKGYLTDSDLAEIQQTTLHISPKSPISPISTHLTRGGGDIGDIGEIGEIEERPPKKEETTNKTPNNDNQYKNNDNSLNLPLIEKIELAQRAVGKNELKSDDLKVYGFDEENIEKAKTIGRLEEISPGHFIFV